LYRLEAPGEEIAAVTDLIERKEYRTMFDALAESVLADKRQAVQQAKEEARQEWERAWQEQERAVLQEREKARQEQERAVLQEQEKARQEQEKARQEKHESARRLKQMGVSPGIIAAGLGLSLEEIERL
jgi:N12 class adenine-specific DNA methylase